MKSTKKQSFIFNLLNKLAELIWSFREDHLRDLNDKIDNLAAKYWKE